MRQHRFEVLSADAFQRLRQQLADTDHLLIAAAALAAEKPHLDPAQRTRFVQRIAADGAGSGGGGAAVGMALASEAAQAPLRFPVVHCVPTRAGAEAGPAPSDITADPAGRRAIERAIASGRPAYARAAPGAAVAAARSAEGTASPALMVYVPVRHRAGGAAASGEAVGIVFARVPTSVLLAEDLAGSTPLALRLTMVDAGDSPTGVDGQSGERQVGVGSSGTRTCSAAAWMSGWT